MRVTLKQIASKAALSVSTASRALNGHAAIKQETIERVRTIADELRYCKVRSHRRENSVTSILAGRNIAIMSLGMDRALVEMPVIANTFHSAEEALLAAEASCQILHMPDLNQLPRDLKLERIDGLILCGAMIERFALGAETPAVRQLRKFPSIWVIGYPPGAWGDSVVGDDFAVGTGAAEQLAANGHRHLAFLNPVPDNLLFARREDGFLSKARRLGLEVQCFCQAPDRGWPLPLESPTMVFDVVLALVDQMLAAKPRPTAVFTAADSVAALVYCALGMRGAAVGKDMGVISGNNTPGLLSIPYPHLATFDIHVQKIGRLAVRQLGLRLAETDPARHIASQLVVQPTFVPGESIGNGSGPIRSKSPRGQVKPKPAVVRNLVAHPRRRRDMAESRA